MDEKRNRPRVRANAIVSFKVKTIRLVGSARIKDISETGICFPSKVYFPLDSILEVEVRSENLKNPIKASARVVRMTRRNNSKFPFEVGLQFLDIPIVNQSAFMDYIQLAIAQGDQSIGWLD